MDLWLQSQLGESAYQPLLDSLNQVSAASLDKHVAGMGNKTAMNFERYRRDLQGFNAISALLDVPGIGVDLFSNILRFIVSAKDRERLEKLLTELAQFDEDEIQRLATIPQWEREKILALVNGAPNASALSSKIPRLGLRLSATIVTERRDLGGRFPRLLELEAVPGLGASKMGLLRKAATSAPVVAYPLSIQFPASQRTLHFLNSVKTPEALSSKIKNLSLGKAKNILKFRHDNLRYDTLGQVLKAPGIGIAGLRNLVLNFAANDDEKTDVTHAFDKLGSADENELATLIDSSIESHQYTLNLLNTAPSKEAVGTLFDGIGPELAGRMVEQRQNLGGRFDAIKQVADVPGIQADRLGHMLHTGDSLAPRNDADSVLIHIWALLDRREDRGRWAEELADMAKETDNADAHRYIAAALLAIDAREELALLQELLGGPKESGIALQPWPTIPEGEYLMGSPEDDELAEADEFPQLEKQIIAFEALAMQVTQALYAVVARRKPEADQDLREAVNQVNWSEANEFCVKMSELQGKVIRLPQEVEWEYFCRAGTQSRYWFGEDPAQLDGFGWYEANADKVMPVLHKPENPFQVSDGHGNVWEWCWDTYGPYPGGAVLPIEDSEKKVLRGGSWMTGAADARSASRHAEDPETRALDIGFRVLRSIPQPPPSGGGGEPPPGGGEPPPEDDIITGLVLDDPQILIPSEGLEEKPRRPITQPNWRGGPGGVRGFIAAPGPYNATVMGLSPSDAILLGENPPQECPCPPCPPCLPPGDLTPEEEAEVEDVVEEVQEDKDEQDGEERGDIGKEEDELEADQDGVEEEEERTDKDKRRQRRKQMEEDLEKERKELDKQQKKLQDEQKDIEERKKDLQRRDRDLREEEQEARRNDPNCRGPHCRNIKKAREDLAEDRKKLQSDERNLQKKSRELNQKERDHRQKRRTLEDLKDRGYGMTKDEHRLRKMGKHIGELNRSKNSLKKTLERLQDKKEQQGGRLSAEDRSLEKSLNKQIENIDKRLEGGRAELNKARDQYKKLDQQYNQATDKIQENTDRINRLKKQKAKLKPGDEDGRQAIDDEIKKLDGKYKKLYEDQAAAEKTRSAFEKKELKKAGREYAKSMMGRYQEQQVRTAFGDKAGDAFETNLGKARSENGTQLNRARRNLQMRELSSVELKQYGKDIKSALNALKNIKERVGKPDALGNNPAAERNLQQFREKYNQAEDNLQRIRNERKRLEKDTANTRSTRNRAVRDLNKIRNELRQRGASEDSTPQGSAKNRACVAELQQQAASLRDEISGLERHMRDNGRAERNVAREYPGARESAFKARPLGMAGNRQEHIDNYHEGLRPYFDGQGNVKQDVVGRIAGEQIQKRNRYYNLEAERRFLKKAIDSGKAPAGSHERLQKINGLQEDTADDLINRGWSRGAKNNHILPGEDNIIGRGILRANTEGRYEQRRKKIAELEAKRRALHLKKAAAALEKAENERLRVESPFSQFLADLFDEVHEVQAEQAQQDEDDTKAKQESQDPSGVDEFITDTLDLPKQHPVGDILHRIARTIGAQAMQQYLGALKKRKGATKQKPWKVIQFLFDELLIPTAQEGNDNFDIAALLGQKAIALQALQRTPPPPAPAPKPDDKTRERAAAEEPPGPDMELEAERIETLEAYENTLATLEEQARQRGELLQADRIKALKLGVRLKKRLLQGRAGADEARATKKSIREIMNRLVQIAEAAGEDALARSLSQNLIEAQTFIQEGLLEAAGDNIEAGFDAGDYLDAAKEASHDLAEDLSHHREQLEQARDQASDTKARNDYEKQATQVGMMEAMHRVQAEEWQSALDLLDSLPNLNQLMGKQIARWKAAVAVQGFAALKAKRQPSPKADDDTSAEEEAPPVTPMEEEFLKRIEQFSDDKDTVANALVLRAEGKNRDEALALLRASSNKHPLVLLNRLKLLLQAETFDAALMREAFQVLAELTGDAAKYADRSVFVSMMEKLGEDGIADLRNAINQSGLTGGRKKLWNLNLGLAEFYAQRPNLSLQETESKVRALQKQAADSTIEFLPGEQQKLSNDLAEMLSDIGLYNIQRDILFNKPAEFDPSTLVTFAGQALRLNDDDAFDKMLREWEEGRSISAKVRLSALAAFVKHFVQERDKAKTAAQRDRWQRRLEKVQRSARTIRDQARRSLERQLKEINREKLAFELRYDRDGWLESAALSLSRVLNFATGTDDAMNKADAAWQESLHLRESMLYSEAAAAEKIAAEIELLEKSYTQARAISESRVKNLETRVAAAEAELDSLAGQAGLDDDATNGPLNAARAKLGNLQTQLESWQDQLDLRSPSYESKRLGRLEKRSATERRIDRLERELYSRGWYDAFGDMGLYGQLDEHMRGMDEDSVSDKWQRRLLQDKIAGKRRRIQNLIQHGPVIDPSTGKLAGGVYRQQLEAQHLESVRRMTDSIAREWEMLEKESPDLFEEDTQRWRNRANTYRDTLARRPELNALAKVKGTISDKKYISALILSLARTTDIGFRSYYAYIPEDEWDRGLEQMWNLHWSETLGIENDHDSSSMVARIDKFNKEIAALQLALITLRSGRELSEAQRRLLVKTKVLTAQIESDGSTSYKLNIGTPLDLGNIDRKLDIAKRSWVDELVNPRSVLELTAMMALGALGSGALLGLLSRSRYIANMLSLTTLSARGFQLAARTLANATAFTGASRVTHAASNAVFGQKSGAAGRNAQPSVAQEFGHNVAIFGALGAFGSITARLSRALKTPAIPANAGPAVRRAFALRQGGVMLEERIGAKALDTLLFASEAAVAAGTESLLRGQPLTMETYVRNLLTIPGVHRLGAKAAQVFGPRAGSIPAANSASGRPPSHLNNSPVLGEFPINRRRDRSLQAKYQDAYDTLGKERSTLEKKAFADFTALENLLEPLGVTLVKKGPQDLAGPHLKRGADGEVSIVIDGDSTRMDVRNELYKLHQLELFRLTPDRPISAEMHALIEYRSYKEMERALFKGTPPKGRYARSIGLAIHWKKELDAIRSGQKANETLFMPGDEVTIFGRYPSDVPTLKKALDAELGKDYDATQHPELAGLAERIRDLLGFHLGQLAGKFSRRDAARNKVKNATDQNALEAAEAEAGYRNRLVDITLGHINPLLDGFARVRKQTVKPTVFADSDPTFAVRQQLDPNSPKHVNNIRKSIREAMQRLDQEAQNLSGEALAKNRAQHQALSEKLASKSFNTLIKERLAIRQAMKKLDQEAQNLSGKALADNQAKYKKLREQLNPNSRKLGELGGEVLIREIPELKDAVLVWEGTASRQYDKVYLLGERVIVVEEKGHTSQKGGKWVGGVRVEQVSTLHTMGTAMEMIADGEALVQRGRKLNDSAMEALGLQRIEIGEKIMQGLISGELEAYITRTVWAKDGADSVVLGETTFDRVKYSTEPLSTPLSTVIYHRSADGIRKNLKVSLIPLHENNQVHLTSNGKATGKEASDLGHLVAHIRRGQRLGSRLVVLPHESLVISRSDGKTSHADLLRDPALAHLSGVVQKNGITVVMGVKFNTQTNARPLEGTAVFHPDGRVEVIPHDPALRNEGMSRIEVDGVKVDIATLQQGLLYNDAQADLKVVLPAKGEDPGAAIQGDPTAMSVSMNHLQDLSSAPLSPEALAQQLGKGHQVDNRWRDRILE